MQDLNDMRYFAEVAERGGFAVAARALGLPKSRLSRRIARLEAELGMRLLQRTTRKLSLTAAGEQYLRHCVAVRDQAEQAWAELAQVRSEPRGTLRVVCPVTLAQTVIGPLLSEYLARHPKVRLDMQVSNRVVDLVEEGVDIALRVRSDLGDSGSVIVKQLGLSHGLLLAAPGLLDRGGRPGAPSDLAEMAAVGMSGIDGGFRLRLYKPTGERHAITCRPVFAADDLVTVRFAVLGGVGFGMLPDYMCQEDLARGRLERVLPEWSLAPGIVHAVYPSRRGMAPAPRSFLDFLGEKLAQSAQGGIIGISPLRR
ncbi:LysR substrate-binding domain-containing protein [Castellaniella sp. GW247-6E4]|uniref:LysR substrate-binding domain-containing protein n=1 Tax=Castellaniella sp. GW247-6E4 TaxID=3140380 RepID=UPI00331460F4